ncbi:Dam family site-specific DNA-(adenine-N6)-methyltransferase [Lentilactobacillus sp. Marseille-Q4993]|uniref:Dam family site-specific DNA-(adenine-N6)-methyltransferase n=1 Tax=Lentilactobacillus sp. Marseille-Q4993 TaxID=3039492 RepID=UPI0024BBF067|nr:Dam family site-specific DNA-(adenine-N6)-methyltransferase [Lentilactobacillus sp. Marseille-Q4993]
MQIQEISKEYNLTLKSLANRAGITYTTLASMKNKPLTEWKPEYLNSVSEVLGTNVIDLAKKDSLAPFIKWVGGKRQLLHELKKYVPEDFDTYYEPFIGGGALLLSIQPHHAVINDWNFELTNTWNAVKNNPTELIEDLKEHKQNNTKDYYLDLRAADRDGRIVKMTSTERAARFIYMNKTGYNGLWRVNSKGQNNVPYGTYANPTIVSPTIIPVSNYLQKNDITILNGDYRVAVNDAKTNDFVYFDPPYVPVSPTAAFTSYTSDGFGLLQQEQLRDTALNLAGRGAKVMLSNADVPLVHELYSDNAFHIHEVQASRSINSNGKKRGKVGEVIITTY